MEKEYSCVIEALYNTKFLLAYSKTIYRPWDRELDEELRLSTVTSEIVIEIDAKERRSSCREHMMWGLIGFSNSSNYL